MSGWPICWLIGHKWYTTRYFEQWHETHRDVDGRPQGRVATYASQICYRCTWNTITRGTKFVHAGPMTRDEANWEIGE